MGKSRQDLGATGEAAAAAWLQARGYEVLGRNLRTRFGEIDLVARRGSLVVVVEVKSRTSQRYGHPADAIGMRKQHRLARLAAACLRRLGAEGCPVRFDAIAVNLDRGGRVLAVEHIPDAFQTGG
jgi:putative endonuclease